MPGVRWCAPGRATPAPDFRSLRGRLHPPDDLCQEPCSSLGLVDPYFDHARAGDILVAPANLVRQAQESRETPAVCEQLAEHIFRTDDVFVVVRQPLMPGYIADGMQSSSADLARPLGDFVSH